MSYYRICDPNLLKLSMALILEEGIALCIYTNVYNKIYDIREHHTKVLKTNIFSFAFGGLLKHKV